MTGNKKKGTKDKMIKALLFDMDGSLIDSMWIWRAIDVEYLGRFHIPLPEQLQQCIEGMSFSETACYFKERFKLPDSVEQIKADWTNMARDKYAHEVPLKAGASELIKFCKSHGIKMGIATSNSRELAETVLKAHGIDAYFDCILTNSEVEKGKPAPDVYLAVAKALQVDPVDCMVVEDIVPGIQAGLAAGMQVCAIYDKYSLYQDEEKRRIADYYVQDFTQFMELQLLGL